MSYASKDRFDWESCLHRVMRDQRRFPWIVFAIGFLLGAWIF